MQHPSPNRPAAPAWIATVALSALTALAPGCDGADSTQSAAGSDDAQGGDSAGGIDSAAGIDSSVSAGTWGTADLSCAPADNPASMPASAREYATLCAEHGLGVPPTVRCEDAVRVPTRVGGEEVFETPASCDDGSMLKPGCHVGSKIGRVQGSDAAGAPLPDVVWVYFCRAAAQTEISSVQLIGYHRGSGATCFFEANEGGDSILPSLLGRDADNGLTAQLPGPDEPDFDRAFVPAGEVQCVRCHQNNAFIRNPWLDGARMPDNPADPVVPALGPKSPYYVVGGADWDMRTIHIEGNGCVACHRVGMDLDQIFAGNGFDTNAYMPPHAPGTMADDYAALLDCWTNGPEQTEGCAWIIPPAGDCEGGIVGADYPHIAAYFNRAESSGNGNDDGKGGDGGKGGGDGGKGGGDDGKGGDGGKGTCPEGVKAGEPCEGTAETTACEQGGAWFWCEGGAWQSK